MLTTEATEKGYAYRRGPIAMVSTHTGHMQCLKCGAEWWANTRTGGKLYRGSWTCQHCGAGSKDKFFPTEAS